MQLANRLWASGIKAEFGFKPNPKMGDQLGYALEQGIPFMVLFGDDELQQGVVKVGVCVGGVPCGGGSQSMRVFAGRGGHQMGCSGTFLLVSEHIYS
jgi:hypothetical protein